MSETVTKLLRAVCENNQSRVTGLHGCKGPVKCHSSVVPGRWFFVFTLGVLLLPVDARSEPLQTRVADRNTTSSTPSTASASFLNWADWKIGHVGAAGEPHLWTSFGRAEHGRVLVLPDKALSAEVGEGKPSPQVKTVPSEGIRRIAPPLSTAQQETLLELLESQEQLIIRDLAQARGSIDELKAQLSAAATSQRETVMAKQATDAAVLALRKSLEEERGRAERLGGSEALARAEIEQLKARTGAAEAAKAEAIEAKRVAEAAAKTQSEALHAERKKHDALFGELTSARADNEQLRSRLAEVTANQAQSEQARRESEVLKRSSQEEVTRLSTQLSLTRGLLDLQTQALDQERDRSEALARDLAVVRQELVIIAARNGPSSSEQPTRDRQSADGLAGDLVEGRSESAAERPRDALARERQSADALGRALSLAESEMQRLQASLTRLQAAVALQPDALEKGRTASEPVSRDLSWARKGSTE